MKPETWKIGTAGLILDELAFLRRHKEAKTWQAWETSKGTNVIQENACPAHRAL